MMEPLNIHIPDSFYAGEVKCDYYISPKMKQVWAVELDLLNEAMRVLEKHHIKYFLGGGTLLGAIRHKGFIPWDDDIDLFLPRNDYNKLAAIAPEEFSYPYHYQDEYIEPGIMYGHSKLRNSSTTGILKGFLDSIHGKVTYNQGIFIDFFPLDNIPDNEMERICWMNDIKDLAIDIWNYKKYVYRDIQPASKDDLKKFLNTKSFLAQLGDPNYFFRKYEALLGMFANTKTQKSCQFSFYRKNCEDKWTYNNEDFEELVYVPFEMLHAPIPKYYTRFLEKYFGDWKKMVRGTSEHGSCYFDVNNPWTDYVDEIHGINKEKVLKIQ